MTELLIYGILETLYMTIFSTALAYILGLPIGVILHITSKDGILKNKYINSTLGVIVNLLRSVPFRYYFRLNCNSCSPCYFCGTFRCKNG